MSDGPQAAKMSPFIGDTVLESREDLVLKRKTQGKKEKKE